MKKIIPGMVILKKQELKIILSHKKVNVYMNLQKNQTLI